MRLANQEPTALSFHGALSQFAVQPVCPSAPWTILACSMV